MSFSWLAVVPVLGVVILIHEIGHFLAALWAGVQVEEFGIGFPPRVWGRKVRGILFSLNLLPLGGFVRMLGEEDPSHPRSLAAQPPGRRLVVLIAGIVLNVLLAWVLYSLAFGIQGEWRPAAQEVGLFDIRPGSPAAEAGLQAGDVLRAINGKPVRDVATVVLEARLNAGSPVELVIQRGEERFRVTLVPRPHPPEGEGAIGIRLSYVWAPVEVAVVQPGSPADRAGLRPGDRIRAAGPYREPNSVQVMDALWQAQGGTLALEVQQPGEAPRRVELEVPVLGPTPDRPPEELLGFQFTFPQTRVTYTPWAALVRGGQEVGRVALMVPLSLVGLFRGALTPESFSGPIGIARLAGDVARQSGVWGLVLFSAFLSVNVGLLNLLPIPGLDGGRILFVLLEVVLRGRRISPRVETYIHMAGIAVLLAFLALISYFDLRRLVGP